MPGKPVCITDLTISQLDRIIESMGEPAYRAGQLRKWVYQRLADSFEEMTDLPRTFREKLEREMRLHTVSPLETLTGHDGTVKTLLRLDDDNTIESALMRFDGAGEGRSSRYTVCVSTQAGCSIGCAFCATGQQGFARNLTPGEIIDQVLYFAQFLQEKSDPPKGNNGHRPARISNVVFMGMGEPLANYDNLWQAVEMLNSPGAFGLGARGMVISTAGLVPQIKRLAKEKLQVGLAVSLHAADNQLRNKLVPLNRKYPLGRLIPACEEYSLLTGRRLSFEYTLFKGINDSLLQSRALAALIKGIKCHVNLIPANLTQDASFKPSPYKTVLAFEEELKRNHVNVTLRRSRGRDIAAGCGQLRGRYVKNTIAAHDKSVTAGKV